MGQVPAVRQVHAEHGIARFEEREVDRHIGLGAGVRLHVGVDCTEQLLGPVARQVLGDIDVFAAAVVAIARVALGVLVGQYRALGFEHCAAHVVFAGDQLQAIALAARLAGQCARHRGIAAPEGFKNGHAVLLPQE